MINFYLPALFEIVLPFHIKVGNFDQTEKYELWTKTVCKAELQKLPVQMSGGWIRHGQVGNLHILGYFCKPGDLNFKSEKVCRVCFSVRKKLQKKWHLFITLSHIFKAFALCDKIQQFLRSQTIIILIYPRICVISVNIENTFPQTF